MTHLDMTHEAHQPVRPPTHTLLDAVAKARQLAAERHETMIVYWDEDYNTYSWLPEHAYHHDPEYQHIEPQDLHGHSHEGYYQQAKPDDDTDATMLEDVAMETWADVDNWTF